MRAAYYEKNGSAREVLRIGEIETPTAGPGEVRVRVATSGVNPSDINARRGTSRKIAYPRVIPHSDGAGEIDQVGAGVDRMRIGERVWIWNGQWQRPFGTCAEYIVLPAAQAVPLPRHLSLDAGACLGIPAMTAAYTVALTAAAPGKTLLISGGAGAVGHYAIQFAKARGAHVIATVSSTAKGELAREAGADHVINYKDENVATSVAAITKGGVDAVIEVNFAANAKQLPGVLQPKGMVVIYGAGAFEAQMPAFFCMVNAITIRFVNAYVLNQGERAATLAEIASLTDTDRLIHNVALNLPLSDIAKAHEAVEQGTASGNVVVRL